jgi:predicted Rossmann fold nucleotide-binding protein DprA/Smf involved in DNA uptake
MTPKLDENESLSIAGKKVLSKLVVNESEILESIVDDAAKYMQIDQNGRVFVKNPTKMRGIDQVGVYIVGKKLAKEARLVEDEAATLDEIAQATGLKRNVALARLSELKNQNKIDALDRGLYRVSVAQAAKILADVRVGDRKSMEGEQR